MAHPVFANPAQSKSDDRAGFITKTYMHLAAAILIFMGLEALLLNSAEGQKLGQALMGHWMWVLGAYMVVSWLCSSFVHGVKSKFGQYMFGYIHRGSDCYFPTSIDDCTSRSCKGGFSSQQLNF